MESSPSAPGSRFVERRIKRKGLRPRVAASVTAVVWLIAIAVFGIVERLVDPDSFDNVWLAMWWATQTVTTVGYGDVVPSQTAGQLVATILMVGGLSLFAVITGMITSVFVTRAQSESRSEGEDVVSGKLDHLATELEAVRRQLATLADDRASGAPPS
jgi:voltage-gated potassium channel